MHLCEIEALAVGQDGSRPGPIAEGQLPGVVAYSHSRPRADVGDQSFWSESLRTLKIERELSLETIAFITAVTRKHATPQQPSRIGPRTQHDDIIQARWALNGVHDKPPSCPAPAAAQW
jgi:hypothetical protein